MPSPPSPSGLTPHPQRPPGWQPPKSPAQRAAEGPPLSRLRLAIHEVIFEADTPWGKAFDVALLALIAVSLVAVSLESVAAIERRYGTALRAIEWGLTVIFTVEYLLRLIAVARPLAYARSFYGVVDLLAILPTYLSVVLPGAQTLLVVRALRLLRIVRVFKLVPFLGEARVLLTALRASRRKVVLFVATVLIVVQITAALMYLIEGPERGFTSIPRAMYWGIVTVTTVGYGDISPQTPAGQMLASILMILGYGIIAVPTGIFSAELMQLGRGGAVSTQACVSCAAEGHDVDARFCKYCGAPLAPLTP
jgi:voltage-gated potassium channel